MTADRSSRARSLAGDFVVLSPSSVDTWDRCPRRFRNRHLLGLPEPEVHARTDEGRLVHQLLQHLHERGDCADRKFRAEVVEANVSDGAHRVAAMLERHAMRCPRGASALGHEWPVARFHRRPPPMVMVTGVLDAVWIHDGLLDVRDYKTGMPASDRLADDPRARVQAWLAAPEAARQGLRLRLRYEFLGEGVVDDPEPWEPSADELDAVGAELRAIATAVKAGEMPGAAMPSVCGYCGWRDVCDEAVTAVPVTDRQRSSS